MLYPESTSDHLNIDLFRQPTVHYRSIPFWSWNCRVTKELIDEQLPIFKQMGFGGVDIHPRSGLDTVYLSDDYMELIRYTVKKCKELGLLCWLYDDDRFPSGAADGLVTQDPRFRQRCLLLTENPQSDFFPDQPSFENAIEQGQIPKGWRAATYAVGKGKARRLAKTEMPGEGETLRYAYVMLLEPEDWFQGQTYVDVMNPAAVRRFIDITHEVYDREVGSDFGDAVAAIFTDEPRMETRTNRHPKQLKSADDHGDVIIPWSDALREKLLKGNRIDLLDIAPALVWELPESNIARYTFRNAAGEQFVTAFLDQIAAWCKDHHILMTGHVLSEDTLSAQAASLGDCMRCYRSMDVPGIDVLCDDRPFLTAKQASSVAHQMDREGVTSELYGVTEWNCDFKTFKSQGDWQAALGVTARVPHLSWMSMEGEAKRDWPGSIFYQSPYWKEFSSVEDYFARLNTVLTRGKPIIDIAVLHPVESMWLHLGNQADTLQVRQEMDARFDVLVQGLLVRQKDFDLISEALLPSQQPFSDRQGLHVGKMTYHAVIVPEMDTIRSTTLEVLKQFHQQGGQVIFVGKAPHLIDAVPSEQALVFQRQCASVVSVSELYLMLDTGLSVCTENGSPADNLLCQRRLDGDVQWLFLCTAYPEKEKVDIPEQYHILIRGHFIATAYDPQSGETAPMFVQYDEEHTLIPWTAYAEDSLLIQLKAGESKILPGKTTAYIPYKTILHPDAVTFSEPNMLLLDYARAQLDGGQISDKMEILRLDNTLRSQLGFKLRYGSMMQPYAMEEKETHQLSLHYEIFSETESPCALALEHPESCEISWNGNKLALRDNGFYVDKSIRKIILPCLRKGGNMFSLSLPYHQKTNLENLYLLGNFDVLTRPAGESVILPQCEKALGDLTLQNMPFWSGEVTYAFSFDCFEKDEFVLRVPTFAAALLKVRLDRKEMGIIAYAPNQLPLGKVEPGRHTLEIIAFIGRHNGFGYLHNSNDAFRWFGPDAWRTQGEEWTDQYHLKPTGILSAVELFIKK